LDTSDLPPHIHVNVMLERFRSTAIALPLIAFTLVVTSGCRSDHTAEPAPPQAPTAKVISRNVPDWEELTGHFQAVGSVEIRPRASGHIDAVLFREGQLVSKSEVLFLIDPRPYQADYDRARAGLELARSQLELAKIEAERAQRLKSSGAISREELDSRVSVLRQQEAQVAASQATLEASALLLSFTKVRSPIDGRVSRAEVTRGNLVSGGSTGGTLLTTVVSVDPIYVYFEGNERSYLNYQAMVRRGTPSITRDGRNIVRVGLVNESGFPHVGYMDFLDNQVDVRTGTIRARAVLENKDGRFTPGLYARVQLFGGRQHEALLVDDRAIGTDQNQRFVLTLKADNTLEYRAVKPGRLVDGLRVVEGDIRPDDVIVIEGLHRFRPGMQVTPQPSRTGGRAPAVEVAGYEAERTGP
jgi:RND family efflux transporter MFP subunit